MAMFWAVSGTISCTAMGVALQIEFLSMVLVGSVLILIENDLAKYRSNGVIGFRLS